MRNPFLSYLIDNYANFKGRATPREYWHFNAQILLHVFFAFALLIVVEAIFRWLTGPRNDFPILTYLGFPLLFLAQIVLFLPSIALNVRRLHDLGFSIWWLLAASALPVLGLPEWIFAIGLFLFLLRRGNFHDNKFGPPPAFDPDAHRTPIQQFWHDRPNLRLPLIAAAASVLLVPVYIVANLNGPEYRDDGTKAYTLIDYNSKAQWVLAFPSEKAVEGPDGENSILDRIESGPTNGRLHFSLSAEELGIDALEGQQPAVRLSGAPAAIKSQFFGSKHREDCRHGEEIAPGVHLLRDLTREEALLAYENSHAFKTFADFYAEDIVDGCIGHYGRISALYTVTDQTGAAVAYGRCRLEEPTCKFEAWLPFQRRATFTVDATDLPRIRDIYDGTIRYLVAATDREESVGVETPDMDGLPRQPFDPATYVAGPTATNLTIDPANIPTDAFHYVYVDSAEPDQIVSAGKTPRVSVRSGRAGPFGIPTDQFIGYWVGKRSFAAPTRQTIGLEPAQGLTIVRINGQTVYEYSHRPITSDDLYAARDNPVFDNGTFSIGTISNGPRPDDLFTFDFPAGESVIEVEVVNDFHGVDIGLRITDPFTPLARELVKTRLAAMGLSDAQVYYFGAYGAHRADGRMPVNAPDSSKPAVAILDSSTAINWELEKGAQFNATIISSYSSATQVTEGSFGDILYLNKPLIMHHETRECSCGSSGFRCGSNTDVLDVAAEVTDLTGLALAGYALSRSPGRLVAKPFTPAVSERIRQLRADDRAARATCG